jgi:hypothetical protein
MSTRTGCISVKIRYWTWILAVLTEGLVFFSISRRDSVVSIATIYGLDDREVGVRVPVGSRIFTSPNRPDRLRGPPNLLSNGYRWVLSPGLNGRGVKLTTHLQLVSKSRKCGSIHPLSIRLHGVVLNYLSTGTTLPISRRKPCN